MAGYELKLTNKNPIQKIGRVNVSGILRYNRAFNSSQKTKPC